LSQPWSALATTNAEEMDSLTPGHDKMSRRHLKEAGEGQTRGTEACLPQKGQRSWNVAEKGITTDAISVLRAIHIST
jgi:hypothetical protein